MRSLAYILEGLEEYYHYTHTYNLKEILDKDTWGCSNDDNYQLKNYPYFISLTRTRNANFGYATAIDQDDQVRVRFNGRKLTSRFVIEPVDFFPGMKNFVTYAKKRDEEAYKLYKDEWLKMPNVEAEERLYSKKKEIPGISKYIDRIDFCEETTSKEDIEICTNYCKQLDIDFKIYKTEREYKIGK